MHSDENQICLFSSWLAGCTRIKLDLFRESLSECFANRLCNIASWSCSSRNATYQMAFQHMHGRRHTKSLYVFTVMTPWDTVVTQHLILHLIVDHLTCCCFFFTWNTQWNTCLPACVKQMNLPKGPTSKKTRPKPSYAVFQIPRPHLSISICEMALFFKILPAGTVRSSATLMQPVDLVGSFTDFQLRTPLR